MALAMLIIAARPPDDDHTYGHGKAEYFSSGAEGILILIAAIFIIIASVKRFFIPQPIGQIGIGLIVSLSASLINLVVARSANEDVDATVAPGIAQYVITVAAV